jgi:16S rRNA (uracil1498-N3)-methyltransferase
VTDHADVRLDEVGARKRLERWRRVSLEALKQSGRRRLVEISAPLTLEQLCDVGARDLDSILVFSERGGGPLAGALGGAGTVTSVAALIGPEGGWSDGELELLGARGAKMITLGPRVLRTETAAIAAITLIQHAIGDLSN